MYKIYVVKNDIEIFETRLSLVWNHAGVACSRVQQTERDRDFIHALGESSLFYQDKITQSSLL